MLLQVLMSRVVGRSGAGGCNFVGLICPTLVGIGLTDLSVKGDRPPAPPPPPPSPVPTGMMRREMI